MRKSIVTSLCLLMFVSGLAYATPVVVPDFAVDPSGTQFTIQPVALSDPGSINLAGLPSLDYGITSVPDGTEDTLMMSWEQESTGDAQAGWELVFGEDPSLINQQIILSINPPGGWTDAAGLPFPGPLRVLTPPICFRESSPWKCGLSTTWVAPAAGDSTPTRIFFFH